MARENQGVQIALIATVILTLILFGTTFYFYKQYSEAVAKEKAATQKESDANKKIGELEKFALTLKKMAGFAEADQEPECSKAFQEDVTTYGAGTPDLDYRKLVKNQQATIATGNQEVENLKKLNEQVNAALKAREGIAQPKIDKAIADADQHKNELQQQTQEYVERRKTLSDELDKVKEQWQSNVKEVERVKAIGREKIANAVAAMKDIKIVAERNRDELDKVTKATFETALGKVTMVNQETGTVWLDLGRADALSRLTTFSVYPIDAADVSRAKAKATVEVTQILGDHSAQARILDDKFTDPILTGDLVFTPIWSPGQRKHFAFVGFIDINDDGRSELKELKAHIESEGGVIDSWQDEQGNQQGKITERTNYLIKGKEPTIATIKQDDKVLASREKELVDGFQKMIADAERLAIKVVPLSDFLDQIGWRGVSAVTKFGRGAPPGQFKARPPEGGNPVSNGVVSPLYQPRKPPRSVPGSAY